MLRHVDFIVNPRAGRGAAGGRAAEAARRLTAAGVTSVVHVPASASAALHLVSRLDRPDACIVACGGDGTVHWVSQSLVHGAATFDILPAGTGNDIHTALYGAVPDPVSALCERILSGSTRQVDVGRATCAAADRFFLSVCTTGFDSLVNERANSGRGPFRYVGAVLRELPRLRARLWHLEEPSATRQVTGVILAIANLGIYGGGMRICPRASADDGTLDVTLVAPLSRLRLVTLFPLVYRGRHVRRPEVSTWHTRQLMVGGDDGPVMCDGEALGQLPVDIAVVPGALRLCGAGVA